MEETKIYVDVTVLYHKDGRMRPINVIWRDGRVFEIQQVTDVRRAASFNGGGVGTRYTCIIEGRPSHLFYEDTKKGFVEGKE